MQTQRHNDLIDISTPEFAEQHNDVIVDIALMSDIVRSFLATRLRTDVPLDELLAVSAAETLTRAEREKLEFDKPAEERDPKLDARREAASTPAYELRYRDCRFSLEGILQKTTVAGWTNILAAALGDFKRALEMQQGGDWHPIAYSLQRDRRSWGTVRLRREDEMREWSFNPKRAGKAPDQEQTDKVGITVSKPVIYLCTVWTNVSRGDAQDTWFTRTKIADEGALAKYVATRQLGYLSAKVAQQREASIELLRRFYDVPEHEADPDPTPDKPKQLTRKEVGMAKLLHDNGSNWGELGALFGVHFKTVQAAVRRLETPPADKKAPGVVVEIPEPVLEP